MASSRSCVAAVLLATTSTWEGSARSIAMRLHCPAARPERPARLARREQAREQRGRRRGRLAERGQAQAGLEGGQQRVVVGGGAQEDPVPGARAGGDQRNVATARTDHTLRLVP